jgi:LytS/YehU family sensor histidine kinase
MRYFLYENAHDTISLEKEIEYLKNYIELQEQRFGGTTVVQFTIKGPDASYNIEPMLLIPFVENAFKHGILQNSSISVNLEAFDGVLNFSVKNRYRSLGTDQKDETSGIGLANVRRRLDLLYEKKHTLIIDDKNEMYVVMLQLKLH